MTRIREKKAAFMYAKIEEWKQSGMTIRAFAAQMGISKSAFEYWITRKRNSERQMPRFIELVANSASSVPGHMETDPKATQSPRRVELTFPNGLCLRIFM